MDMCSEKRTVCAVILAALVVLVACGGDGPPEQTAPPTPLDLSTVGTIDVTVSYAGPVPPLRQVNMASTPACAAAHKDPVYDDRLLVQNGRLANAFVWIRRGLEDRVFARPTDPVVMDQRGCLYVPRVAGVILGQPVRFVNSDSESHNVHGKPKVARGWNFMMSRRASTRTIYVSKPEVAISVGCDVHPWMQAYIAVVEHPYFAVTPAEGRVSLRQVPPGDYELAVWHERLGTKERAVTLAPKGTASVRFDFQAQ